MGYGAGQCGQWCVLYRFYIAQGDGFKVALRSSVSPVASTDHHLTSMDLCFLSSKLKISLAL